jgi:hypothetical protein
MEHIQFRLVVSIHFLKKGGLFDIRQEMLEPAAAIIVVGGPVVVEIWAPLTRRESTLDSMVIVQREADLPEMVLTLDAVAGFADFLDRRQQQGDQDADNGNHHQKLDEREAAPTIAPGSSRYGHRYLRYHCG